MNVLIIGGTGKTGKELIKQALELGYNVTALVRDPGKVKDQHPKLKVIQGNVMRPETFGNVFQEQDVVLSALGHKKFFIKTNILSKGTENIIAEMQKHEVNRFICITSLGVNDSRFKLGLYYTLFVIPFIVLFYFLDKSKQEEIIKQSQLNWTIVRPGQLIDGKKRMKYKHGENVGSYILTKMISRADVAHFMLSQINNDMYWHKTPGITY